MTADTEESIVEQIRSLKEENAAAYDYSLEAIIASAREHQETSGREVIRLAKGEQAHGEQRRTRHDGE